MEFFRVAFKLVLSTGTFLNLGACSAGQELDSVIPVCSFQFRIFCDSMISEIFSLLLHFIFPIFCSSVTAQPLLAIM